MLYKLNTALKTVCISKFDLFWNTVNYKISSCLKSNFYMNYKASSAVIGQPRISYVKLVVCSLIKRDNGTSKCNFCRFLHTYTKTTSQCKLSLLNFNDVQLINADSG